MRTRPGPDSSQCACAETYPVRGWADALVVTTVSATGAVFPPPPPRIRKARDRSRTVPVFISSDLTFLVGFFLVACLPTFPYVLGYVVVVIVVVLGINVVTPPWTRGGRN